MRFVILTGMSGAGKSTAMKMMEDIGYYCVDNLPISLLEPVMELSAQSGELQKVAVGIDVRSGRPFEELEEALAQAKKDGWNFEVLFMEADDDVLLKRYKETRRSHPLAESNRLETGIGMERKHLQKLRKQADHIINTSHLLTRELKEEINRIFLEDQSYKNLFITILSFGYKFGIPTDSDLVFDVRFLPNPFYVEGLRNKTGEDKEVRDYVMQFPEAHTFLDKLTDLIDFLLPNYVSEGKSRLVISIGCTGGKHRSVTLAKELYGRLINNEGYALKIEHRDITRNAGR